MCCTALQEVWLGWLTKLSIASNALRRSLFNRVEYRMAPVSQELAGLILSHVHYGSHLDEHGDAFMVIWGKSNFEFVGRYLQNYGMS